MARGAWEVLKELVVETVGEAILSVVAILAVVGLGLAFVWGMGANPVLTLAVVGIVVLLTAYGGWVLLRRSKRTGRGRLATVSVVVFVTVAVLGYYGYGTLLL
ncbi:hypothetical protein [Streptomyces sp. NPDC056144]|uniref:hypothetical protein n=1 Tax=unclassified Streptomyces TaxID=2593676 RepID=UPI0035DD8A40